MKGGIALLAFVPSLALACINDRDTIKFEQQNVDALNRIQKEIDPGKREQAVKDLVLRAIGGRFERYPEQYYKMRISRLEAKPKLTALEYDDLAVAYDRIGGVDFAIAITEKSLPLRKTADEKYRFHANYGTFLVHKWVSDGAKDEDKATLKKSIAEIEAALKINPSSHFGREKVQLALEKSWFAPEKADEIFDKIKHEDVLVGASGIIMMGLGYELPDMYEILRTYQKGHTGVVFTAANLRYHELVDQGNVALFKMSPDVNAYKSADYTRLREDGERVHQSRMKYMAAKFDQGQHPDTDPSFWSEWKEPDFPTTQRPTSAKTGVTQLLLALAGIVALAGAGLILGVKLYFARRS